MKEQANLFPAMGIVEEEWRDVPEYEGLYQVSNMGRVKSLERIRYTNGGSWTQKSRIRKLILDTQGYFSVCLSENGKIKQYRLHQLVATAFLEHQPNGYKIVVDHIDNNKLNNTVENLQLITQRENSSKDRTGGSSQYTGVTLDKSTNKWRSAIQINGKMKDLGYFIDEYDAHLAYQKALSELK